MDPATDSDPEADSDPVADSDPAALMQVSWVKMGPAGAAAALRCGCNDLGGTLMNESIRRSSLPTQ